MESTRQVNILEVCDLKKQFDPPKGILAVAGISFQIQPGEIFSLLGPNGAGKTTTISIICGLLQPTEGDALVAGFSIRQAPLQVKERIGVVPQEIALYGDLSSVENLEFWGRMYGLGGAELRRRSEQVLEITGLGDRRHDRVSKFSGGMKRRLNIGIALMHRPQLIIMDEPTVGIDPQSRRHILDSVLELNRQGASVLYTTHYMEEAQELSKRIAIMDQGRIIALGSYEELVRLVGELDRVVLTANRPAEALIPVWQAIPGVSKVTSLDGQMTLLVQDSNLVLPRLFETAIKAGARITSVQIEEPNLEAVFLHLTGRALRD